MDRLCFLRGFLHGEQFPPIGSRSISDVRYPGRSRKRMMIDLHSHLLPGVDDGAVNLAQTRAALTLMRSHGVSHIMLTPHVQASDLDNPRRAAEVGSRLEAAWAICEPVVRTEFPDLTVDRGAEVMLDTPTPNLSEPWTRLAGTAFVLVEFPGMTVPPRSSAALRTLRDAGYLPVVAHPERYGNLGAGFEEAFSWLDAGAFLQVNSGSLTGRYGRDALRCAWTLLERSAAAYLAGDYHARGRYSLREATDLLKERGGEECAETLVHTNPARLLRGEEPLTAASLEPRISFIDRIFGRV